MPKANRPRTIVSTGKRPYRHPHPRRSSALPASIADQPARVIAAYHKARTLLRRSYVTGVFVGHPAQGGKWQAEQTAIVVMVTEKKPLQQLRKHQHLPRSIGGVRVDVIQGNPVPRATIYPGQGITITTGELGGTLGMLVRDPSDQALCLLSAAHVLNGPPGTRVMLRGGPNDGAVIAIIRNTTLGGQGDGGFADLGHAIKAGFDLRETIPGLDFRPDSIKQAKVGMVLEKYGAFTRHTTAIVHQAGLISVKINNSLFEAPGYLLWPIDGFQGEISDEGDSGSIWCNPTDHAAVALTIAGEKNGPLNSGEFAYACDLLTLLEALKVQLP